MPDLTNVKALVFDVFGTVVDWRTSVIREIQATAVSEALEGIDAPAMADDWRAGYPRVMQETRDEKRPFATIDTLHRAILDEDLAPKHHLETLTEAARDHLNRAWHRLDAWPDSVAGLTQLKQRYTIATLSNGNVALLNNMAKRAGLPWDVVLSAELFGHFKPDPEVYLGAARLLGLTPSEAMMVAAHPGDLRAAAAQGLRTAYLPRPLEWGPDREFRGKREDDTFDLEVDSFVELTEVLDPSIVRR
jgi:2-haloacid dehalogenase